MTDRLSSTATVYLKNGARVFLSEPATSDVMDQVGSGLPVRGVDTDGRQVALTSDAYLSAVGPQVDRTPPVAVPSDIFDGRHTLITSAANMVRASGEDIDPQSDAGLVTEHVREPEDLAHTVVVQAQDLADAVVLIMDLRKQDDDLLWINPAADPVAIDLTVKAVRALAEAEQREILFNDPANDPSVTAPGYGTPEAERLR